MRSKPAGVFFGFPRKSLLSPQLIPIPPPDSKPIRDKYFFNANKKPVKPINRLTYYAVFLIFNPHGVH